MVLASFVFLLVPCLVLSLILRHARACSQLDASRLTGPCDVPGADIARSRISFRFETSKQLGIRDVLQTHEQPNNQHTIMLCECVQTFFTFFFQMANSKIQINIYELYARRFGCE